jgi:hypothetical protein
MTMCVAVQGLQTAGDATGWRHVYEGPHGTPHDDPTHRTQVCPYIVSSLCLVLCAVWICARAHCVPCVCCVPIDSTSPKPYCIAVAA